MVFISDYKFLLLGVLLKLLNGELILLSIDLDLLDSVCFTKFLLKFNSFSLFLLFSLSCNEFTLFTNCSLILTNSSVYNWNLFLFSWDFCVSVTNSSILCLFISFCLLNLSFENFNSDILLS